MTDTAPYRRRWLHWVIAALLVVTSVSFVFSARAERHRAAAEAAATASALTAEPVTTSTTAESPASTIAAAAAPPTAPARPTTTLSAREARESPAQRAREHPNEPTITTSPATFTTTASAVLAPQADAASPTTAPTFALDPDGGHETAAPSGPAEGTILGINPEATYAVAAATILGLLLALAVAVHPSRGVLAATAAAMTIFAALDLHERAHQQHEGATRLDHAATGLSAGHALTALLAASALVAVHRRPSNE